MSATSRNQRAKPVCGFSMLSAIFLIVVLALLGAAMAKFSILQHTSSTLDFQGVRAYQAAQGGIEWGMYRILDPDSLPSAILPSCWVGSATITLVEDLAPFTVTVSCVASTDTDEDGQDVKVYKLTASSSLGNAGTTNYVERQVEAVVSRCKNSSNAPSYAC